MLAYKLPKTCLALITVWTIICLYTFAHAEGDMKGYVGVLGGVGVVNNSGGANFTYGAGVGYKFQPQWSVGLDYTYNTFAVPSPFSANLSTILANIKYYFVPAAYFGIKLGSGTASYSGLGAP